MRVDTSGNVGIGTSSPASLLSLYSATSAVLSINGDSGVNATISRYSSDASQSQVILRKARGTFASPSAVNSGDAAGYWSVQGYGGTNFRNLSQITTIVDTYTSDTNISAYMTFNLNSGSTGTTERMRITSSGNVGIGTTSPGTALEVAGGATNGLTRLGQLQFKNSSGNYSAGADGVHIFPFSDGMLYADNFDGGYVWRTGVSSTEAARIDPSSNLTVGATSMPEAARVGISSTSASAVPLVVQQTAAGSTTQNSVVFYRNSTSTGTIQVTGTTTAYNTSSDYRLKENVQPMTGALGKVALLKPCNYTWKADGSDGEGFIAHELQAVIPNAVTGKKDGEEMQGVDYGKITPLLTAALQEAIAEIKLLKARVAELEEK